MANWIDFGSDAKYSETGIDTCGKKCWIHFARWKSKLRQPWKIHSVFCALLISNFTSVIWNSCFCHCDLFVLTQWNFSNCSHNEYAWNFSTKRTMPRVIYHWMFVCVLFAIAKWTKRPIECRKARHKPQTSNFEDGITCVLFIALFQIRPSVFLFVLFSLYKALQIIIAVPFDAWYVAPCKFPLLFTIKLTRHVRFEVVIYSII